MTKCLDITAACLAAGLIAFIIAQHKARSGLATDHPFLSTPLNVAEPCRQDLNDAPVLGHFYTWRLGDDGNPSGRTRPTPLGPLAHALRLASGSLS